MKKKGYGDLSSGLFMEFEESDEFFGVSSDEEYAVKLDKFILETKENTEVFSLGDEFGNYFNKNIKKV